MTRIVQVSPHLAPEHKLITDLQSAVRWHDDMHRGSGRSEHMLQTIQPPAVILTSNEQEAKRLRRRLVELGKTGVTVTTNILHTRGMRARVRVDHEWARDHFLRSLDVAQSEIDAMESAPWTSDITP